MSVATKTARLISRKVRSSTAGLRFHDLRHHAITELAESQASDRTVMSIAGHVSHQMLAHYSHVRMEAKRKALDALAVGGIKTVGYDTKNDTKSVNREPFSLRKLLKRMAGTTGLEPAASAVTGQRSNQLNYVPASRINAMRKPSVNKGIAGFACSAQFAEIACDGAYFWQNRP